MSKICSICQNKKYIVAHHLSYEPEIITWVCVSCHLLMHKLANKTKIEQEIIFGWVKQYGKNWDNCSEKYRKSFRYKNYNKEFRNTEKGKLCSKKAYNKWANSEKGCTWIKNYKNSDEYKKRNAEWQAKYRLRKKILVENNNESYLLQ